MGRSAAGRRRARCGAAVPAGTGAGEGRGSRGGHPHPSRRGEAGRNRAPRPPAAAAVSPLSFPLQDLLEALGQLQEEEGEPGLEDEPMAGAEDGGSEWDLPGAESGPPGAPLPAPSPPQPAEGQNQWRSLLSSYRRRHFSGCFGTRMERIGAQTGLGCNQYKARRCRVRARGSGKRGSPELAPAHRSGGGRGSRRGRPLSSAESLGAAPPAASSLPFSPRFLEEREKLKPGPAPKRFLSLQAGAHQPDSQARPRGLRGGGRWSNKLLYKACIAFSECFFRSRRRTRSQDREIPSRAPLSLCLKGSLPTLAGATQPVWTSLCRRVAAAGGMVVASFQDNDQSSDPPRCAEEGLSGTNASSGTVAVSRDVFPDGFTAASCESSREAGTGLGVNSR